jgi:hypothetical protein
MRYNSPQPCSWFSQDWGEWGGWPWGLAAPRLNRWSSIVRAPGESACCKYKPACLKSQAFCDHLGLVSSGCLQGRLPDGNVWKAALRSGTIGESARARMLQVLEGNRPNFVWRNRFPSGTLSSVVQRIVLTGKQILRREQSKDGSRQNVTPEVGKKGCLYVPPREREKLAAGAAGWGCVGWYPSLPCFYPRQPQCGNGGGRSHHGLPHRLSGFSLDCIVVDSPLGCWCESWMHYWCLWWNRSVLRLPRLLARSHWWATLRWKGIRISRTLYVPASLSPRHLCFPLGRSDRLQGGICRVTHRHGFPCFALRMCHERHCAVANV